jgi:hypothetical protein
MVIGEGFGPAAVPASKSGKFECPGLALETDQHEWRRTLRAKGPVAGCQGIQEKIFNSAHGRTPSAMVRRFGTPFVTVDGAYIGRNFCQTTLCWSRRLAMMRPASRIVETSSS